VFLNQDGTINIGQMVADAQKGGGSKLPDGVYTSRLLSVELSDARGAGKVELPGKKRLNAKFTILTGEHEKEELYVSYNLFNKSERVGSTSGTVRFLTDLEAIGEGVAKQKGIKLVFDTNGNMAVLTKTGPSVEALKAVWAKAFAGKTVQISSETQIIYSDKAKTVKDGEFALRLVVGLTTGTTTADESTDELPDAPSDDEVPY
jgi:hypothetical protein